jgi:hypothetical protein
VHKIKIKTMDKAILAQLKKGLEVEKEHTDDLKIALKIAIDHIKEDPKYYDKLASLGLEEEIEEYNEGEFCTECLKEYIINHKDVLTEAEYQGRKVQLGKPFLTPDGPKKRAVYVKNKKGNVIKINFGQKGVKIKKNNPKRRKSFRARHKCHTAKDRTTPRYWSCRFW